MQKNRELLKPYLGSRVHVSSALFVRTGSRYVRGYEGKSKITTYLFRCIRIDGEMVAEHIWIDSSPGIRIADLQSGDVVSFDAAVSSYLKVDHDNQGNATTELNYNLTCPNKFYKISRSLKFMPQEEWEKKQSDVRTDTKRRAKRV